MESGKSSIAGIVGGILSFITVGAVLDGFWPAITQSTNNAISSAKANGFINVIPILVLIPIILVLGILLYHIKDR